MTTRFTKTPIFWGLLSKVLSRPGTGSLTARPRCHPGKKPLQTSGSQWNVPGRSGMSISTCTVMNSTRITMRLRLVFWKKKIYIYLQLQDPLVFVGKNYVYIHIYAMRFFPKTAQTTALQKSMCRPATSGLATKWFAHIHTHTHTWKKQFHD